MHMCQRRLRHVVSVMGIFRRVCDSSAVNILHHQWLWYVMTMPHFYRFCQSSVSTDRNQKLKPPLRCGLFFFSFSPSCHTVSSFMSNIPQRKRWCEPDRITFNAIPNLTQQTAELYLGLIIIHTCLCGNFSLWVKWNISTKYFSFMIHSHRKEIILLNQRWLK